MHELSGENLTGIRHRAEPVEDYQMSELDGIERGPHLHLVTGESAMVVPFDATAGKETGHNNIRHNEVYRLTRDPETYEVTVESDVTVEDIEKEFPPEDIAAFKEWAKPFIGKTITYINPTMEGGGVAMMRPTLIHYLRLLGVDARWVVMEAWSDEQQEKEGKPFEFTKQMHNVSQRMSDQRITEEGKKLHWAWADRDNGPVIEAQDYITDASIVFLDDPQTAPLFRRLKAANPEAKFVWRNHIDTDHDLMADPTTPQGEIAYYLMEECGLKDVDAIIAHPVFQFIHPGMENKTYFAPATFDVFDNLNRHLNDAEIQEGIQFINQQIRLTNAKFASQERWEDMISEISPDPTKQRITLIARFDPAKGMPEAMKMGVEARRRMQASGVPESELPEVIIVGNGSVDDPDGDWMFEKVIKERREKYPDEKDEIRVVRLHHNYDAINALMTLSSILMQTSWREGLETRAGDGIKHGVPVVISNRGGIQTQVVEGKSGFILDFDRVDEELSRGAEIMSYYLTHPEEYAQLVETTKELGRVFNRREFSTLSNAIRQLRIFNEITFEPGKPADKVWKLSELTAGFAE